METVKEVKEPTQFERTLAIEVACRFIGSSRGIPIAKAAFVDGALWAEKSLSVQTSELKAEIDTLQSELYSCRNKIERLEKELHP